MEKKMKTIGFAILVILLSTTLLSACASATGNLEGSLWRMTSYRNADGMMVESLPDVRTTAEFKEGQVGGKAACNNYSGAYEIDGKKISFGMMRSTMMACPEPIMSQEMGYLAALEIAASFDVTADSLTLFDAQGEILVKFEVLEPASLTGTDWLLTSYNNGKGGMQSVVIGTEISANFSEDGTMSGSAGCNSYSGSYESTEDTISIGPIANTEMACMDPEGVMEQETQYLTALQNAAVYTIQDDLLEIRDENGSGVAYFKAGLESLP
jgi:heat shock protein HslJ